MRFPPAGWAWPPGPRVAAAHNSGVDGRRDGREKGPMQATSGPQRDKTRPAARLGGPPGTKLSQQAPKRRFRPTFRMQGELCTASATNNPSRENFIPHAVPLPVQNCPRSRPWQAHPVQNSPSTPGSTAHPVQNSPSKPQNANFGPLFACRENFLPLPPPTTRAGRTLYRFRHQHDEHGELYPACGATSGTKLSQHARLGGPPGTKLSQQAALAGPPGTKLSQHARLDGPPGTKLSQRAPKRRFWPIFRMHGELCTASATNNPSRENFIPHAVPLPVQNSPRKRLGGPPGTKLSQQAPKRRFRPTFRMQGELCTASATNTTSREKKVTHQHPTAPTNAPLPKFRMQFD